MRAETMMKEYKQMKMELQVTEMQLSRFRGITGDDVISMMTYSRPEGDERVQTSSLSDKTAKAALNYRKVMERENDEWYGFLMKRYRKLSEEISFFEESVQRLSGNLPEIMTDLLDGEMTWDEVSLKHHISRRSVGNYRKQAVKELNAMYELREKCAADYMLS